MRKLNILLLLLWFILTVSPVYAQTEDRILEFKSSIIVDKSTQIDIEEKILFQPSLSVERHGLEWRIPYTYSVGAFRRPTKLEINSVKYYPLDSPEDIYYNTYSREDQSGWANLRIGKAEVLIFKPHVYLIDYTLTYTGVSYFKTHEEIFLNVIGPGWNCPIENASVTFTLPADISEAVCYTGPDKSVQQDCTIEIEGKSLTVRPNHTLNPYEGYTVVIKQPVGTFENTTKEQARSIIISNLGILLPIPVLILFFIFRKIQKNKEYTIVPQYEPPVSINALSGAILSRNNDMFNVKYVSALLIEMAIKGYYKIREFKKKKYELVKIKGYDSESEATKYLLDSIFVYGDTVPLTKLTTFYTTSQEAFKQTKKKLFSEGYLLTGKNIFKNIFLFFSIVILVITAISAEIFIENAAIGTFLGLIVTFILLILFVKDINIKSEEGNQIYSELMGLKMYIKTAEQERIKFHNNPNKYKEVFEKLLPYAMIFGLEKKWAEQFKDIYTTPPEWYDGNISSFDTIVLTNSLSSFNRSVIASSSQSNYSSFGGYRSGGWSSGGSGFGGGGSSGGGGGGSGGGGW